MQWKISASEKASAVEQQYEDLRDRLDELGDFGFLDEIQDDNMHQAEMPFRMDPRLRVHMAGIV